MDLHEIDEFEEPKTFEKLTHLDQLHYRVGLGDLWMVSKRRAELLKKIRQNITINMEAIIPETMFRFDDIHGGKRVPVVAYFSNDGSKGQVVGEAILSQVEEGVIAKVEIQGEFALNILKDGTEAFSIGIPPVETQLLNEQVIRPSRWERRGKKMRKE